VKGVVGFRGKMEADAMRKHPKNKPEVFCKGSGNKAGKSVSPDAACVTLAKG
jgi:hypothetical protein